MFFIKSEGVKKMKKIAVLLVILIALALLSCGPASTTEEAAVATKDPAVVTGEVTPEPTEKPTPETTEEPTPEPTEEPTPEPTEEPTPEPTEEPTPVPTEEPASDLDDEWKNMPIITHVYELSKEMFSVEWEGNAELYQVYVDGKKVSTVNYSIAYIDLKTGVHKIVVIPVKYESKNADTTFELNVGILDKAEVGGSIDLGALGIDPKDLVQGTPSKTFSINYTVSPLLSAVPEIVSAYTDFDDRVLLTFTDKYDSDVYRITIKSGKDVNYVEFDPSSADAAALINKTNSQVTIILDQEYLKSHRCFIPELDQKYSFFVKLQRYPDNYVDGKKENSGVLESKDSKAFDYTPYAAWKNAPEIIYASQTADGQVTLRWAHDDNGLGCEYKILRYDKVLGIKTGETEIGKTSKTEFIIKDLMNGKYIYAIVPLYSREQGLVSEEASVEVKNNWVVAPALTCELGKDKQVILKWSSPENIESYHVVVYAGSGSLLRFINLDYKKYSEFDVQAKPGDMEYTFTYNGSIDPENGVKLKFEIYGVRHATNGKEQKSATTTQTIVLKKDA